MYEEQRAAALVNLGGARQHLRKPGAADALRQAIALLQPLAEQQPGRHGPALAAALNNLGVVLLEERRLEEAEAALEQALDIYRSLSRHEMHAWRPALASALANLAGVRLGLRNAKAASDSCLEAVKHYDLLVGEQPQVFEPSLAMALDNLGLIMAELDRPAEAIAAHRRALDIRRRLAAKEPAAHRRWMATTLTNLGGLLYKRKQYTEAEALLREGAGIERQLHQAAPAVYGPNLALALYNLGLLLRDTGRRGEAAGLLAEATRLDPGNMEGARWQALRAQAGLEREQGNLHGAHRLLRGLLDEVEQVRGRLTRRADRMVVQEEVAGAYVDMIDLCIKLARREDSLRWRGEAWQWAERRKGRTLSELLDEATPRFHNAQTQETYSRWQGLRKEIEQRQEEYRRLTANDADGMSKPGDSTRSAPDPILVRQAREALEAATTVEDRLRHELARLLDEGAPLVGVVDVPAPDELAAGLRDLTLGQIPLPAGERRPLLVDFALLGRDRYAVFLLPLWRVSPGADPPLLVGRVTRPEGSLSRLYDTFMAGLLAMRGLANYRSGLEAMADPDTYGAVRGLEQRGLGLFAQTAELIGEHLVRPWAAKLNELGPTELLLIPAGPLHLLPLHAGLLANGDPLIARYPVTYLPNAGLAATLAQRRDETHHPSGRLVMGPPGEDLAEAADEAEGLARLWELPDAGDDAQPYSSERMTIRNLKKHAGQAEIVHLATHSAFDPDYLQSHIAFNDGPLSLLQLISDAEFSFNGARLVYLDSCESAMTMPNAGDELQGLVWGLTYAGAEAVMASLWLVDDEAAGYMAGEFYSQWPGSVTPALAHQRAVERLRSIPNFANPYYWAPFVLNGNGFQPDSPAIHWSL